VDSKESRERDPQGLYIDIPYRFMERADTKSEKEGVSGRGQLKEGSKGHKS